MIIELKNNPKRFPVKIPVLQIGYFYAYPFQGILRNLYHSFKGVVQTANTFT